MICQNICPVNKPSIDWLQHIADFSEEETNLILRNTKKDNLPLETRKKLQLINLFDDYNIIPRNLMALINKSRIVS
jgi:epoxyqueuosine reductase